MAKIECSFEMCKQTSLGVPFILLLMILNLTLKLYNSKTRGEKKK